MEHWLVIETDDTDLCFADPGLEETVWVETNLCPLVEIKMGWSPWKQALNARDIVIDGSQSLGDDPFRWTAQSPLAGVKQRLREERIGEPLEGLST